MIFNRCVVDVGRLERSVIVGWMVTAWLRILRADSYSGWRRPRRICPCYLTIPANTQCCRFVEALAVHDGLHRRITPQFLRAVYFLVVGQAVQYRPAKQAGEQIQNIGISERASPARTLRLKDASSSQYGGKRPSEAI